MKGKEALKECGVQWAAQRLLFRISCFAIAVQMPKAGSCSGGRALKIHSLKPLTPYFAPFATRGLHVTYEIGNVYEVSMSDDLEGPI